MEALFALAVVIAAIAVGAFARDRYDNPDVGSNKRNASSSHRHIDDYERHASNRTQKLR